MRQTEFKRGVDKVLYNMEYDFAIEIGKTSEEAHSVGLKKIDSTYAMAENVKNEKYIDITTGKQVTYTGW